MKNKSIFAFDILDKIGDLISESATGIVQRPSYMPITTPFIIP